MSHHFDTKLAKEDPSLNKVAPKAQHLWPFSCLGYVEMGDEKIGIRRLEHS